MLSASIAAASALVADSPPDSPYAGGVFMVKINFPPGMLAVKTVALGSEHHFIIMGALVI